MLLATKNNLLIILCIQSLVLIVNNGAFVQAHHVKGIRTLKGPKDTPAAPNATDVAEQDNFEVSDFETDEVYEKEDPKGKATSDEVAGKPDSDTESVTPDDEEDCPPTSIGHEDEEVDDGKGKPEDEAVEGKEDNESHKNKDNDEDEDEQDSGKKGDEKKDDVEQDSQGKGEGKKEEEELVIVDAEEEDGCDCGDKYLNDIDSEAQETDKGPSKDKGPAAYTKKASAGVKGGKEGFFRLRKGL